MNPNGPLPALDGKIEQLAELCRQFHVNRQEIFVSASRQAIAFRNRLSLPEIATEP